ncbi:protein kinase domain-containing protein [Occultella gossypii]|uniref:non-specific serine/threonine protein kinase n=1 Tax=Occultella gossypii TaxID=2800820 RepID=A0ABS7S7K5_9MICO|nr:protein kinase [Occultella gossypii]MBZ2195594.1 protein kinase [Occultella gossypii]
MSGTVPEIPGYQITGPLGFGAPSRVWAAREAPARGARAVAIRVSEPVDEDRARARRRRLGALGGLDHPGLARVLAVHEREDGRCAVVQELIDGPTLATVRAGRHGLDLAETLGLVAALADAVSALHAAGVVHGDISPANILLRTPPPGPKDTRARSAEQRQPPHPPVGAPELPDPDPGAVRPVLVDLLGGTGTDAGTEGFRAPELVAGQEASASADLYSIGAVARWAVADAERPALREILGELTAREPRRRPSLADVRAWLAEYDVAPVRLPDARTLAGASLREHARREETIRRPVRRPRGRARHRRSRRWRVVACAAMMLGALVGAASLNGWGPVAADPQGSGEPHGTQDPTGRPGTSAVTAVPAAVPALTAARDVALAAGDAQALAAVSVPGSPAAAADAELLAALATAGVTLSGLATAVTDVEVVSQVGDEAVVRAVLTQGEHQRTAAARADVTTIAALPPRCVEFTLALVEPDWLTADVAECAP